MTPFEEEVYGYVDNWELDKLDALFEEVKDGSLEKREVLSDAYLSCFGQCHYDFYSQKFTKMEEVSQLFDWAEKAYVLSPQDNGLHELRARVYEMLSLAEDTDDPVKYNAQCIEELRKQIEIEESAALLVYLSEKLFQHIEFSGVCEDAQVAEIKRLLVRVFALKPIYIGSMLAEGGYHIGLCIRITYAWLKTTYPDRTKWHLDYLSTFSTELQLSAESEPKDYYYWANELFQQMQCMQPERQEVILMEIKRLLKTMPEIYLEEAVDYNSLGHLYANLAYRLEDVSLYKTALNPDYSLE
ncbi:hypothetical protein LVD15_15700 [Fulvivirga maritima]|uniref:hypothetical protein n=1 Tax=Fulvivirga maritima TaxID=2904247 RepID=UPI001F266108|nr:hypothetical protein [Fulvivirga maritima]UII24754.1 hypothetical protein LVD15_15700 [Fulvivirga maritima]